MRFIGIVSVFLVVVTLFFAQVGFAHGQMKSFTVDEAEKPVALSDKDAPPDNMRSVTPVADCFSKMEWSEVVDIRRNFAYPYTECMRRINEREAAAGDEEAVTKDKEIKAEVEKDDKADKKEDNENIENFAEQHKRKPYNE